MKQDINIRKIEMPRGYRSKAIRHAETSMVSRKLNIKTKSGTVIPNWGNRRKEKESRKYLREKHHYMGGSNSVLDSKLFALSLFNELELTEDPERKAELIGMIDYVEKKRLRKKAKRC